MRHSLGRQFREIVSQFGYSNILKILKDAIASSLGLCERTLETRNVFSASDKTGVVWYLGPWASPPLYNSTYIHVQLAYLQVFFYILIFEETRTDQLSNNIWHKTYTFLWKLLRIFKHKLQKTLDSSCIKEPTIVTIN